MNNILMVIHPYKYNETWVFDDERVGLIQEPFISGADEIIEKMVSDIPDADKGFTLLFSASPFPGYQAEFEWRREEFGGNWYYSKVLDLEGWLCPALLKYFDKPPKKIFAQFKAKATSSASATNSLQQEMPEISLFYASRTGESPVPRLVAVHDLSCFGRAALTVVTPILSAMGIQVCPIPTAVLSTHGRFPGYTFIDLTEHLQGLIDHWRTLELRFNAIYSGFLGSVRQIETVSQFIRDFAREGQLVVIDPVLGDNGKLYGVTSQGMVEHMQQLICRADVITPNLTEAALLLDEPYREELQPNVLKEWLLRLAGKGPKIVIVTSIPSLQTQNQTTTVVYNRIDGRFWKVSGEYIPAHFPGTGDAFTSIVVGGLLQGEGLLMAVGRAMQFISTAIRVSLDSKASVEEGMLLEQVLHTLKAPIISSRYEILE